MAMLKNRKLLLTGVTGRVGGAFANALVSTNELWGMARFSDGSRDYWERRGMKTLPVDIADGDFSGVPTDFDYVIHPGAWSGAAVGPQVGFETAIRVNAEGTGLLMAHCRKAKAFLHVSTCGVYAENPDPNHRYTETDPVHGFAAMRDYAASKLIAEGAVRTMARHLNLPTVMCRLNVQYGPWGDCGMPNTKFVRWLLDGTPVPVRPNRTPVMFSPVYNDDLIDFLEPCLEAASVPATIVNWGGDEPVSIDQMVDYLGELIGKKPIYREVSPHPIPALILDNSKRMSITGPCKVHWKEGLRRMVAFAHPELPLAEAS
jgi:nucleoside-diphosphate-sugar epimerase